MRGLARAFPHMQTPANDLALRTHEILENTLQFELTGDADEGSHTTLATALANVQGTQLALGAIANLLRQRNPQLLGQVSAGLAALPAMLQTRPPAAGLDAVGQPDPDRAGAPGRRRERAP